MTTPQYREAIAALARHSEDGATDAELRQGAAAILGVLHARYSRDGENRGGSAAADQIERACDEFDAFDQMTSGGGQ